MIIMMIFNMTTSYFHKISFHYFEDYLMMKLGQGSYKPNGKSKVWQGLAN
jgi:hypothetical protein